MIILLLPWVLLLAYFGGLLFVLGIPARLAEHYTAEELGHGGQTLQILFTSNMVVALFSIIAGIAVIVLAFAWMRNALYRNRGESVWISVYIAACTLIMVVAAGVTSYSVVVNNDLYDHISNAHTDRAMLEGGAHEEYAGVAYIRGTASIEGDAGDYFVGLDDWYYDLRILENGTNWKTVYLPIGLAAERGIETISTSEPYDSVTVQYMPNTYVVSEIWRAGQEPVEEEDTEDADAS